MGTAWVEGSESMTYEQLEVNTEIRLKEKQDGEGRQKMHSCSKIPAYVHSGG